MIKKIYLSLLTACMIFCMPVLSVMAKQFTDLDQTHWAYSEIVDLEGGKIIVGYPDGSFKPDQSATRAEFATMAVKALRQQHCFLDVYHYYKDVPKSHWAFGAIEKAHKFDLIKGYPETHFRPSELITRLDAVLIMVASVNTTKISDDVALRALNTFKDANKIPVQDKVNVGKAQLLGIVSNSPDKKDLFEPNRKITRAEIAYSLYNMRKQALQNPNPKLAEALKPKFADGYVLDKTYAKDNLVTIPAGTMIPALLVSKLDSQQNNTGDRFIAKTYENIVTRERYLLFPKGSVIDGNISSLKSARYFIRNAKMIVESRRIKVFNRNRACLLGNMQIMEKDRNWFQKVVNFIFKGSKIRLNKWQKVYIKLNRPIKVDITNQAVISE